MLDLNFLFELINPIILGICLLLGYALKTAFTRFPRKYIPFIAILVGTVISILMNIGQELTAEVVLIGMISGLASTGLYEMLCKLLNHNNKDGKEKD